MMTSFPEVPRAKADCRIRRGSESPPVASCAYRLALLCLLLCGIGGSLACGDDEASFDLQRTAGIGGSTTAAMSSGTSPIGTAGATGARSNAGGARPPTPHRLFSSTRIGVAFEYPASWVLSSDTRTRVATPRLDDGGRSNGAEIQVSRADAQTNATVQDFWLAIQRALLSEVPGLTFGEPVVVTAGGQPGIRAAFYDPEDGAGARGSMFVFVRKARAGFVLVQAFPPDNWLSYEPDFAHAFATLRFLD